MMDPAPPAICIIDDDESVRRSMSRLFRAADWNVELFSSAHEFMQSNCFHRIDCIVLDLLMPDLSGLQLYEWMLFNDVSLPVVFLSGYGDIPTSVYAMKCGAADFLVKPVDDETMLETIRQAIHRHAGQRIRADEQKEIKSRHSRLTTREQEVMAHVIQGRLNKQIASDLRISLKTVKVHRARAFEKMEVHSVAELVHLCETAGIPPAHHL